MRSLRIFRPLNLIFLVALQWSTFYFLNFDIQPAPIWLPELVILISSTVLLAAMGYLINDWYDVQADEVNKPRKVFIRHWTDRQVLITFLLGNVLAIAGGWYLGQRWGVMFTGIAVLLWLYSIKAKHLPFAGNLIISWFGALSVYIVFDVFQFQSKSFVVFFAVLSAAFTLLRELAKDIEDIPGDAKAGYSTFPVLVGFERARTLLLSLTVFIGVMYTIFQYNWIAPIFDGKLLLIFVAYQLICILLPILVLIIRIFSARSYRDMTAISRLFKYVMATGMLSMLFF
ncbi:MAG: UbiA family prenyltransferase [Bacteroidetes bacterium]|nr:UbiA family prenyltransferase [Bacteroidota bacterium]